MRDSELQGYISMHITRESEIDAKNALDLILGDSKYTVSDTFGSILGNKEFHFNSLTNLFKGAAVLEKIRYAFSLNIIVEDSPLLQIFQINPDVYLQVENEVVFICGGELWLKRKTKEAMTSLKNDGSKRKVILNYASDLRENGFERNAHF